MIGFVSYSLLKLPEALRILFFDLLNSKLLSGGVLVSLIISLK
jgi:hypothetical protein